MGDSNELRHSTGIENGMPVLRRGFDHATYSTGPKTITLYPGLLFEDLTRYATIRNTANAALTQPFAIGNRVFIGKVLPVERYGMMPTAEGIIPYSIAQDTKLIDVNTYLGAQDLHVQETFNTALKTIEGKLEQIGRIQSPKLFWYAVGVHENPVGTTLVVNELAYDIAGFMRANTPVAPDEPSEQTSPIARPTYRNGPIAMSVQQRFA